MNALEYYFLIDQKYHEEVYQLLQVLENDLIDTNDTEGIQERERAESRLEELIAIKSIPK